MEQAKKRDHKILITDIAIDKVPYVQLEGFNLVQSKFLQQTHKELLRKAKNENNSNEVVAIYNFLSEEVIYIKGTENKVVFDNNLDYKRIKKNSYNKEIMLLHNHPATSNFSLKDISEFYRNDYIVVMSVVTNQGGLYLLQKNEKYDYDKINELFLECLKKYDVNNQESAVNEFLKYCSKGGVTYVKGN